MLQYHNKTMTYKIRGKYTAFTIKPFNSLSSLSLSQYDHFLSDLIELRLQNILSLLSISQAYESSSSAKCSQNGYGLLFSCLSLSSTGKKRKKKTTHGIFQMSTVCFISANEVLEADTSHRERLFRQVRKQI